MIGGNLGNSLQDSSVAGQVNVAGAEVVTPTDNADNTTLLMG